MPSISFMVHFFIPFQRTITTWAVVLGLQLLLMDPSRLSAQQGESQASAQGEEKSSEEALIAAEYRELLELDDMALQEVDDWIRESNATNDGVDDTSLISLPARIEQRLKPVRAAYDAFIQKHPKHVGVRLAYASFLTDRGDEVLAAPHLMKATELNPENPAAWNNLGNHYGHLGPVIKAFECYGKAIKLNPNAAVYFHNYGTTVYLFRKDAMKHFDISESEVFDKALKLYRKALEKEPGNFDLAEDIAQTYYGIRNKAVPPRMVRPDESVPTTATFPDSRNNFGLPTTKPSSLIALTTEEMMWRRSSSSTAAW